MFILAQQITDSKYCEDIHIHSIWSQFYLEKKKKNPQKTWRIKQEYDSVIKWAVVLCMFMHILYASLNFLGLSTMDIFYLFSKDNKHYCNSDVLNSKTQSDWMLEEKMKVKWQHS